MGKEKIVFIGTLFLAVTLMLIGLTQCGNAGASTEAQDGMVTVKFFKILQGVRQDTSYSYTYDTLMIGNNPTIKKDSSIAEIKPDSVFVTEVVYQTGDSFVINGTRRMKDEETEEVLEIPTKTTYYADSTAYWTPTEAFNRERNVRLALEAQLIRQGQVLTQVVQYIQQQNKNAQR